MTQYESARASGHPERESIVAPPEARKMLTNERANPTVSMKRQRDPGVHSTLPEDHEEPECWRDNAAWEGMQQPGHWDRHVAISGVE
jgi:hypothetical protein